MPWFECSNCCDSIKKPKVAAHARGCAGATFTCLDCSRTFDQYSVQKHTSCVTEEQKYALGATKPGGSAAQGYFESKNGGQQAVAAADPPGAQFLSSRPPWKCSLCNVSCTSLPTLVAHANGTRHMRRVKAATSSSEEKDPHATSGTESQPTAGPGGAVDSSPGSGERAHGHAGPSCAPTNGRESVAGGQEQKAVAVATPPQQASAADAAAVKGKKGQKRSRDASALERAMRIVRRKQPLSLSRLLSLCRKRGILQADDSDALHALLHQLAEADRALLDVTVAIRAPQPDAAATT